MELKDSAINSPATIKTGEIEENDDTKEGNEKPIANAKRSDEQSPEENLADLETQAREQEEIDKEKIDQIRKAINGEEALDKNNPEQALREKIKHVVDLPFGVMNKAQIALILLDEKPALEFDLYNLSEAEIQDSIETLKNSGLVAETAPSTSNPENKRIIVAKKVETIEELRNLSPDSEADHKRYGQLMGFPDTAIEAFLDETKQIDYEEQRKLLEGLPHLFGMRMSKEHAQEELATIIKWYKLILKYVPELFDELYPPDEVERLKKNIEGKGKIQESGEGENIENKFKNSKVRDEKGKLLVVYHYSNHYFDEFSPDFSGKSFEGDKGFFGAGIYFTEDNDEPGENFYGKNKYSAYLNLKKPLIIKNPSIEDINKLHGKKQELLDQGYDGVMIWNDEIKDEEKIMFGRPKIIKGKKARWSEIIVFDPKDIHIIKKDIKQE